MQQQMNQHEDIYTEDEQTAKYNQKKIKRIINQTMLNNKSKNKNKKTFEKLILRNCKMIIIPQASILLLSTIPQFQCLKELNLSEMGLKYLSRLPKINTLVKLDLTMNEITDNQIQYILIYANLELLYLTENRIRRTSTLDYFKKLSKLKQFDISANPIDCSPQIGFTILTQISIFNRYSRTGNNLQRNAFFNSDSEQQELEQQEEKVQQYDDEESQEYSNEEIKVQESNVIFDQSWEGQQSQEGHSMKKQRENGYDGDPLSNVEYQKHYNMEDD